MAWKNEQVLRTKIGEELCFFVVGSIQRYTSIAARRDVYLCIMSSSQDMLFKIVMIIVAGVIGFFSFRDFIRADYKDGIPTGLRWRMAWLMMLIAIIYTIQSFFEGE